MRFVSPQQADHSPQKRKEGRNPIVSSVHIKREKRFRAALEAVNRRHSKTLKALAK